MSSWYVVVEAAGDGFVDKQSCSADFGIYLGKRLCRSAFQVI